MCTRGCGPIRWKGLLGLADRLHKPRVCPRQVDAVVEVRVAAMRRKHPPGLNVLAKVVERRHRDPRRAVRFVQGCRRPAMRGGIHPTLTGLDL